MYEAIKLTYRYAHALTHAMKLMTQDKTYQQHFESIGNNVFLGVGDC
jgi:hypothetical protein